MSATAQQKKKFDYAALKRVFRYAIPYKRLFLWSLVLSLLLAAMAPLRPYLIQQTVTVHIASGNLNWVIGITIFQVVLLMIESFARFRFTYSTASLGQHVVHDLRRKIYAKVLGLNLSQYDQTPIGTLTTRTINDIESINEIFADGLIPIISDLLSILSILLMMFFTDWKLTLVCLAPFPLIVVATYFFKESVNKSFTIVRNAITQLNSFVQEHLTGIQAVQAFAAEDKEFNKFRKINREHRDANIKAIFAYSVFFPVVEIILALSVGLLVWWGAGTALGIHGGDAEMAGKIIAFVMYLNLLFRPLRVIADKFNVLQMGMIASERVFKMLDNPDYIHPEQEGSLEPLSLQGGIEFREVWFAYLKEQYVLKDLNFSVAPGEVIALVGHTGSGKTSIISLLNRLYQINKGQILIDGHPIESYKTEALRKHITLRNPSISREQVEQAARMIGMHDFIMQLPGGYDFDVKERGGTLSLGQRQLLSFIRALLYNPSILVLDEATSSVDTESELLIQKATETLISGRTSIIIAHRLSTIRKADKIIVLDKGVIREMGTHEELLQKQGSYAQLYQMQFAAPKDFPGSKQF